MTDPSADMLTRIRNGYLASHKEVKVDYSKMKEKLAKILVKKGFLKTVEVKENKHKNLVLTLNYKQGEPAILHLEKVSKPGRKLYIKAKDIRPVLSGLGIMVISTPQGLMTGAEARERNLGGEIICKIW